MTSVRPLSSAPAAIRHERSGRKTVHRKGPRGRGGRYTRLQLLFLAPAGVFLLLFCVYPLEELLRMSVSRVHSADLLQRQWTFVGLDNYAETMSGPDFVDSVVATLLLMVIVVSITLVGGVASAFILQRRSWHNQAVQALMVFLWAMPPLVTASIWKFLLAGDGLLPTLAVKLGFADEPPTPLADPDWALLAVAVGIAWTGVAFASLVMRAGLLSVDRNQLEAAALDGASRTQTTRYILLPALRPSILVQALLAMIYAFRIFDYPFIMTSGGPGTATTTLPYLAYKQSFGALDFGVGAATATISVLVVLIFSMFYLWLMRDEEAT